MKSMKPSLPKFQDCTGCGVCSDVCNKKAIEIIYNKNGFLSTSVYEERCIDCGMCEKVCPVLSEENLPDWDLQEAFPCAAWSLNDELRYNSSSGGAFAQMALELLKKEKSIIVGACLQPNNRVEHIIISEPQDIIKLQGSKYIQSETSGIYKKTFGYLKEGYRVLFSGTPCQVAGMYKYIGTKKHTGELYTAEVICHGVPSKSLLEYAMKKRNVDEVIAFRTKNQGWGYNSQRMVYRKGNQIDEIDNANYKKQDWFYRFFLVDLFLRPSCYSCKYGKLPRKADISLADFWGIKKFEKEQYKGISLLLLNSEKGHALVNSTSGLFMEKIKWEECLPTNRHIFFSKDELKSKSFSSLVHMVVKLPLGINKWLFFSTRKLNPFLWFYLRRPKQRMNDRKNKMLNSLLNRLK